jgi:hypothetical protein
MKNYVDSLVLPEWFAKLEYPLALNYPIAGFKIQKIG